MRPAVGATVLYTLGPNRHRPKEGLRVCFAQVVRHNRDGTLALWVVAPHLAPHSLVFRPWVPPARGAPGSRRAAGMWSPAAQA